MITVRDETKVFWLQRASADGVLLTEREVPLPSPSAIKGTAAPFAELVERDAAYLAFSPALLHARASVCQVKIDIDEVPSRFYYRTRNRVFPDARSGAMSAKVGNRAAYKLLESMSAIGVTRKMFGDSRRRRRQLRKLRDRNKAKAESKSGAAQQQQKSDAAPTTTAMATTAPATAGTTNVRVSKKRVVTFVDVCGGPGSFAQALLDDVPRGPGIKVRGFGMTLTTPGVPEVLLWYKQLLRRRDFTVTNGVDGTGSVYAPENVEALASICAGAKVNIVMGDGGFDVDVSKLTMQEAISARIVFSQWLIALRLLAEGGALILKLFETGSVFLRSMLTLSCLFFRDVAIVKPLHSRVVNSERYLSCTGFRTDAFTAQWQNVLCEAHATAFEQDDCAPFTLLPNVELNPQKHSDATSPALMRIFRGLEPSIVQVAERQVSALSRILNAWKECPEEERQQYLVQADGANDDDADDDGGGGGDAEQDAAAGDHDQDGDDADDV